MNEDELKVENGQDVTVLKIVQELHETQSENIKLLTRLEFMELMLDLAMNKLAYVTDNNKDGWAEIIGYEAFNELKKNNADLGIYPKKD